MTYRRTEFNADYVASLSLADFTNEYKSVYFLDKPEGVRIEMLGEVHKACCNQVNGVGEPQPQQATPAPVLKVEDENKDAIANNNALGEHE